MTLAQVWDQDQVSILAMAGDISGPGTEIYIFDMMLDASQLFAFLHVLYLYHSVLL